MSQEVADRKDDDTPAPPPIAFLPWHGQARDRVGAALAHDRLPHGLLLQGPAGVGKEHYASALAAGLFCTGRGERFEACGLCAECQLSRAGTHPDVHWVRPLEDKKTIGVDQVREVCEKLAMTSMRRGYRVAIVVPAEKMTPQAQNALLKTLEEPAPRTVLVLVTARPSALLPTLRSRCQRIEVARPESTLALRWLGEALGREAPPRLLAVAGGAPLKALGLAPYFDDLERQMTGLLEAFLGDRIEVTRAAADMQGEGLPARLDWLETWLGSAVQRRVGVADETGLTFRAGSPLQRAPAELNITATFQVLDRLREARRLLEGSASAPLVVETLLLELRTALRSPR
ncbi:MAG TPA: DNA polymerase III subunit delta' [Steroidobacteraceae bacterium]|nr:DNA polymerase III subunit delta' [Steroidobacteraceae bacterium]